MSGKHIKFHRDASTDSRAYDHAYYHHCVEELSHAQYNCHGALLYNTYKP